MKWLKDNFNSNDESFRRAGLFANKDEAENEETSTETMSAEETLEVPEDIGTLDDEQLTELLNRATEAFDSIYGDGDDLSNDDLDTLSKLTSIVEELRSETDSREQAAKARVTEAAELAQQVRGPAEEPEAEESTEDFSVDTEAEEDEAVIASSETRGMTVNLKGIKARQRSVQSSENTGKEPKLADIVAFAPDASTYAPEGDISWNNVGQLIDNRLRSFNSGQFDAANRSGRHIRQQYGVLSVRRPYGDGLTVKSDGAEHVSEVMDRAVDESSLPGGSLVASGGWCAPSETLYDFLETETRDGLLSIPEIGVSRGGLRFTQGPDFSDIYTNISDSASWDVSETDDENGHYDGSSGTTEADKPCFKVDCPDFTDHRLRLAGLCLSAGLLQQRGYPEVISRTVRGALVAHDHLMSKRTIDAIVTDSTAVSMTTDQVGTAAPVLEAIELQATHYRNVHRLAKNATLEGIFPNWIFGAIRSDLSRRAGVDLISVTNQRIRGWFSNLGINPQFVYNWQDLGDKKASSTKTYPGTVKFLLYNAGTWVRGGGDVLTLDTVYDSNTLKQNDYTALFTEEGYVVAKRGHDSRVVTVPVCSSGGTNAGVDIDCDGTEVTTP